jgi:6,7-dimethyl-8-ribityllumazine synthase
MRARAREFFWKDASSRLDCSPQKRPDRSRCRSACDERIPISLTFVMALDPKSTERPRLRRPGARIAAAVSRFHEDLTGAMLASAVRELAASGVREADVRVAWVPGAFELPLVARTLARRRVVDAVLCIGLVLKGETEHDRWVAEGAVHGLMQASLETDKPLLLGVLTCATLEQARARALPPELGGREDKGREIARAALETLAALDAARSAERRGSQPAQKRKQSTRSDRARTVRRGARRSETLP